MLKKQYIKQLAYLLCMVALPCQAVFATQPVQKTLYDQYPWGGLFYYGQTLNNPLIQIFTANWHRWPEQIQSAEISYTLSETNIVRRFFDPLVTASQIAGNVTVRNGKNESRIIEVDPYFLVRWGNFAWNNYVNTSFAIGEGISYASSVPAIEKRSNTNVKRLLNYLMFEATFAAPNSPRLQLVARIHHRSGAYGLYQADNNGSNDIGLGVRYLFS